MNGPMTSRVPPHDLEAEESLLGAMLLAREAIVIAIDIVSPADFYRGGNRIVFEAIRSLHTEGDPADPVTVADRLRRGDLLEVVGGAGILIALQAATPATGNAGRYARIVEELAVLRRMIRVAGEIAELGYSMPEDVTGAIERVRALVDELQAGRSGVARPNEAAE